MLSTGIIKESTNGEEYVNLCDVAPLKSDEEEVKEENNSYKLKNKTRQILYLLYQHNKITKKVYSNFIKLL